MTAEERITQLRKTLEYHIDRYYNQDSPEITDYEYDMMMQELKKLEKEKPQLVTPDSPTQKVGGTAKRTAWGAGAPQCADVKPSGCFLKGGSIRICGGDAKAVRPPGICCGI